MVLRIMNLTHDKTEVQGQCEHDEESEEYFLQVHCVAPGDSGRRIVRFVVVEVIEYYARPIDSTSRYCSTNMLYRFLADAVVLIHILFVVYAIAGGLLVLKWKFTIFLHIPALLWGAMVEAAGWICPLTPLENRLRNRYIDRRRESGSGFDEEAFLATYAILAAERTSKNLGVFARLAEAEGRRDYLQHMPRVRNYLARALAHPALDGYAHWCQKHLPPSD